MGDILITGIVAAIAPTLASIGAIVVSLRNSRKADTIVEKTTTLERSLRAQLIKVNRRIIELQQLLTIKNADKGE